jgi:O-antigen/teichoic acid export membrane protein
MQSTNKVILNTSILYFQLILGAIIGLITTRIVLVALGETDYGIYMLVAGVIGILNILNSNMSLTSVRYLAHSLGSSDQLKIRKTFNTTLLLHLYIGLIVVIMMEISGLYIFDSFLNIPPNKIGDAKIIYQFMILTTFITVISSPYDAIIFAHENLLALSIFDLVGSLLKLGAALLLLVIDYNAILLYGFLILIIQILLRIIKQFYSRKNYKECEIKFREFFDKGLMKEIFSFTIWNLFGSLGALAVIQIRSILINMFFGVKVNAAEGITNSATSQINLVAVSMTKAISPQLNRTEGSGDRNRMIRLTELSTKYSIFIFSLTIVPIILNTKFLLELWLVAVPDFTIIFIQIVLITMLVEKFTFQITDAIRAVGNIKKFQIIETFLFLLNIPLTYLLFANGLTPVAAYLIGLSISIFAFAERLYFGKLLIDLNIKQYLIKGVVPFVIPLTISLLGILGLSLIIKSDVLLFFVTLLGFSTSYIILYWFLSMNESEKEIFRKIIKQFRNRFIKKSNK